MRRNWRAPITPADLAPVREAKSDPIPSASLTGLRTQITRPPSDFCRFAQRAKLSERI